MPELIRLSPPWWADRLVRKLRARRPHTQRLRDYRDGNHPLERLDPEDRVRFNTLQKACRSNWTGLIADAVVERMQVLGFRLGLSQEADAEAWRIWQANHLDALFDGLLSEAAGTGYGYSIVWPNPRDAATPAISIESADEVIVEREPGGHRPVAAAKLWHDELAGRDHLNVFLPEGLFKYAAAEREGADGAWEPRLVEGEPWPLPNPYPSGRLAVVEFLNRPNLAGVPKAEFEDVISDQDRLNSILFLRAVATYSAAHKQRWVKMEGEEDEDGNLKQPFQAGSDRLWHTEDPAAEFGEFSATSISGYTSAAESDIQAMAAISRTPPHYLLGQSGSFPSGDSLKATETGLVAKTRKRMRYAGESIEEVVSLAFELKGVDIGPTLTTWWADPESRSISELSDAAVKQKALGIPDETAWENLGYTPTQIIRMKDQQDKALRRGLTALGAGVEVDAAAFAAPAAIEGVQDAVVVEE